MASYYVRSSATGAANGTTWADAYTTLASAVSGKSAGDDFFMADDHNESIVSTATINFPGTAASPNRVICCSDHSTEPPTNAATSAVIGMTNTIVVTMTGFVYFYGISFNIGTAGSPRLHLGNSTLYTQMTFKSCSLTFTTTSTTSGLRLGTFAVANSHNTFIKLNNTPVKFGSTSQKILLGNAVITIENSSNFVDSTGTIPTVLFEQGGSSANSIVNLLGLDLSALGSGKYLFNPVTGAYSLITLIGCKLSSALTILQSAILGKVNGEIRLIACDSTTNSNRFEYWKYGASIVREGTIVKTNGANNGNAAYSLKIVSLSSGLSAINTLELPSIIVPNTSTGSSKTITLDILHDSATGLTNADIYVRAYYLGSSATPIMSMVSTEITQPFASGSTLSSSSATWTTTGMTNPNKQQISVSLTPQMAGNIVLNVFVTKPNYTLYLDPNPTVS